MSSDYEEEVTINVIDNEVIMIEPEEVNYEMNAEADVIILIDSDSNSSPISIDSSSSEVIQLMRIKLSQAQEVLKVLPNAQLIYVETVLAKYQSSENAVNDTIDDMLEGGYEKETADSSLINFASTDWNTSQLYRTHALLVLKNNFPYLEEDGLAKVFQSHHFHYHPTYMAVYELTGCVAAYNAKGLIEHIFTSAFLANLTAKCSGNPDLKVIEVSTNLTTTCFEQIESTLQQELLWLENKINSDLELVSIRLSEEIDEAAIASGSGVECGCCFAEYARQNMRRCSQGHQFCRTCIAKYVEQTVFGDGRSHLKCLSSNSSGSCDGHFSEAAIRASVRGKVFNRYCEALTLNALKDRLKTCYHCQLQLEVDPSSSSVFSCPNCYKSTCILCGDEAHILLKCNEVEKKHHTRGRVTVEEAMTQARVRVCPRCSTRFYKTEGCNKMNCTCGGVVCYLCRADITVEGYTHFCQAPHCDHSGCGKCRVDTNTVEDDKRAMLEAGLKTLQEVEAETAAVDGNTSAGSGVKIEVGKLLEGGM